MKNCFSFEFRVILLEVNCKLFTFLIASVIMRPDPLTVILLTEYRGSFEISTQLKLQTVLISEIPEKPNKWQHRLTQICTVRWARKGSYRRTRFWRSDKNIMGPFGVEYKLCGSSLHSWIWNPHDWLWKIELTSNSIISTLHKSSLQATPLCHVAWWNLLFDWSVCIVLQNKKLWHSPTWNLNRI